MLFLLAIGTSNSEEISRYISGFNECIREVTTYLSTAKGLDEDARINILTYLSNTLLKAQYPTGFPAVHGYDPIPPSDLTSLLPHVEPYKHMASCSKTSHPESNSLQEVSRRPQVTSLSEDRASFQESSSNLTAATKSWLEEVSLPPIHNFCLHEQNSFKTGKTLAQTNVPMKVVPAWLASGKRILLLTGSQSAAVLPVMSCAGSWLVNSQTSSKPNTDIGNREKSISTDPSFVFASSDSFAILGNEPNTEDSNKLEADTICDVINSEGPTKIVENESDSKSDRYRIADSDDIIASPRKVTESDATDRSDWRNHQNEPDVAKLATSSDMWRPW